MELKDCAKIFKALSNETRLSIFLMIYHHCQTDKSCKKQGVHKAFTKACDYVNISRSTISHHLKELQNAGLITVKRQGQAMACAVNPKAIEQIKKIIE